MRNNDSIRGTNTQKYETKNNRFRRIHLGYHFGNSIAIRWHTYILTFLIELDFRIAFVCILFFFQHWMCSVWCAQHRSFSFQRIIDSEFKKKAMHATFYDSLHKGCVQANRNETTEKQNNNKFTRFECGGAELSTRSKYKHKSNLIWILFPFRSHGNFHPFVSYRHSIYRFRMEISCCTTNCPCMQMLCRICRKRE